MKKNFWSCLISITLVVGFVFTGCATITPEEHYSHGRRAFRKEGWDVAIAEFTEVIRQKPDYERVYNLRGWAYLYKGDSARAEKDFNEALRINPSDSDAMAGLRHVQAPHAAYLLFEEGNNLGFSQNDLAIEKYTQAIALFPDYYMAYIYRGDAYLEKEMYAESEADYKEALRIDPQDHLAYLNLITIKRETGDLAAARHYAETALKLHPASVYAKKELERIAAAEKERHQSASVAQTPPKKPATAATSPKAAPAAPGPVEQAKETTLVLFVDSFLFGRKDRDRKDYTGEVGNAAIIQKGNDIQVVVYKKGGGTKYSSIYRFWDLANYNPKRNIWEKVSANSENWDELTARLTNTGDVYLLEIFWEGIIAEKVEMTLQYDAMPQDEKYKDNQSLVDTAWVTGASFLSMVYSFIDEETVVLIVSGSVVARGTYSVRDNQLTMTFSGLGGKGTVTIKDNSFEWDEQIFRKQ